MTASLAKTCWHPIEHSIILSKQQEATGFHQVHKIRLVVMVRGIIVQYVEFSRHLASGSERLRRPGPSREKIQEVEIVAGLGKAILNKTFILNLDSLKFRGSCSMAS